MRKSTGLFIILLGSYLALLGQPKVEDSALTIKVRVIEQLKGSIQVLPNKEIQLLGIGTYQTDEEGRFEVKLPTTPDNISIKMNNFEVIRPYKGMIPTLNAPPFFELDIIAVSRNLEEEYRLQLNRLSQKLSASERKNDLSLKRLNVMNDSLLASLQHNAAQKAQLKETIQSLEDRVAEETSVNQTLQDDLIAAKTDFKILQTQLQEKEEVLYQALEEQYLRQQNYFQSISADLKDYLFQLRDVQDILKNLDQYFRSGKQASYFQTYDATLRAYNGTLKKVNEQHQDYIQGVEQYWDHPTVGKQVEETFAILFDQIHHPQLKPAINTINNYLRDNRRNKAIKLAKETDAALNTLVLNFEKSMNKTIRLLEERM